MSYQHLINERYGPVGWLIHNRPDVRNAMNNAMRDEFAQAWTELNEDPSVRVIVHTGEGRDFQTGVDVGELATDGMGMERYRQSMEDFDVHFATTKTCGSRSSPRSTASVVAAASTGLLTPTS